MPLYYNTASPTSGSKNSITGTALGYGLRDFLLHKNIQNPIKYPFLSTSINGAPKGGEPILDLSVGSDTVIQHVSIEVDGVFRYNNAVIMNHYKNLESNATELISIENISKTANFPTSANGSGDYSQEDITQYGLLPKTDFKQYRKLNTIKNLYLDYTKQIDMAEIITLQPIQTAQQLPSYLDEYGALNLGGGASVQAADVIGSVLNGQGLGLAKGGIVTNYDIRSSLAGRVLTATGLLTDTKLGVIGGQQLALALANNAAFNAEQLLFGKLNVSDNILSLVKTGQLAGFRPDFKITTPTTTGGQVADYTQRILGFTVPVSFLTDAGSIFSTENGNAENIKRANSMLEATGQGQIQALGLSFQANLIGISQYDNPSLTKFRNGYAPNFKKGDGGNFIVAGQQPSVYAYFDNGGSVLSLLNASDNTIPMLSYNREGLTQDSGFVGFENNTYSVNDGRAFATKFAWTSGEGVAVNAIANYDEFIGEKKSLLAKTQQLFNSIGMKTMVSVKGDMKFPKYSQVQTSIVNGGMSKGSAVMKGSKFNSQGQIIGGGEDAENTFCRVWTPFNRYDTVNKLIRHKGLNQAEGGGPIFPLSNKWRNQIAGSVLDDNGFVKIAPYKNDGNGQGGDNLTRNSDTPKKYMFSIENLAWVGTPAVNLLPCEQGPGDLLTGKFGRIMWFPPYDLTFSESSSVSLESTNFIGRGEPIYTYNNTERTGNLSFKIIVDHPSIMNSFAGDNGPTDEFIRSWFAGCVDLDSQWADKLTQDEKVKQELNNIKAVPKKVITPVIIPDQFNVYFKNDITVIDNAYESVKGGSGVGNYVGEPQQRRANGPLEPGDTWPDNTNFGLNGNAQKIKIKDKSYDGWLDPNYLADLGTYLANDCKTCKARVVGFASSQGVPFSNNLLAKARANALKNWLISNNVLEANRITTEINASVVKHGAYAPHTPVDQLNPKSDRFASVVFENDQASIETEADPILDDTNQNAALSEAIRRRFYTECDFFEKIKETDPTVYDKIRQKIKYFSPAFHSMTPEGFNSRLTFLLQCTRQGPTIKEATAKNLAFGPPPVCILRIGDFYNTKIMIDNMSFNFDEQLWDLNPEGIGVQPMIATVNISFKYIGGSSLYGPINKLQNALSFNYFANAHVYDPRADYIAKASDISTSLPKDRNTFKASPNSPEPNYGLVTGLDMTSQSMQLITPNELQPTNAADGKNTNQVKTADVSSSKVPLSPTAGDSAKIVNVKLDNIVTGSTTLDFRIANNPQTPLTKQYGVSAKIVTSDGKESYQVNFALKYGANIYQKYSIDFAKTIKPFAGFESGKTYNLIVNLTNNNISAKQLQANI
jgi:outer membrane protein OmpA-like peptidoglycan-associated protein